MKLTRIYIGEDVKKQYVFDYDKKSKKRPSWLKFKDLSEDVQFVRIDINDEPFWYRRYFENYFFPLNNTQKDFESYYDEIAEKYDLMAPQNKNMAIRVLDKLKENKISLDAPILDLGAGTGLVTELIADAGYTNITLLDISKKCLEVAKRKSSLKNCKTILADMLNLPNLKSKFSVIFSTMSLDYFREEDIEQILRTIKDNLLSGGLFIVIERHIYPQYKKVFSKFNLESFSLTASTGEWKYNLFVGKNE